MRMGKQSSFPLEAMASNPVNSMRRGQSPQSHGIYRKCAQLVKQQALWKSVTVDCD